MPATTLTREYQSLLSTTVDYYQPTLVDNIHKAIPFWWYMTEFGRGEGERMVDGGELIQVPVVNVKNPNVKSISPYGLITVNPTEEITSAFDSWRMVTNSVSISMQEMLKNRGRQQKMNLVRSKVDVMEQSTKEEVERMLVQGEVDATNVLGGIAIRFRAGNNGLDINPLGLLIQKNFDVTAGTVKVHNIDQKVETWWQNRVFNATGQTELGNDGTAGSLASNFAGLRREMETLYTHCSKGATNDAPDLILGDRNYFTAVWNSMLLQQRFESYSREAATSMGFQSLMFNQATLMWSEFVPNYGNSTTDVVSTTALATQSAAFYLNTRWLEIVTHQDCNFITSDFEEPIDQAAAHAKLLYFGNLICTQRRKLGLHYGVDATITS
jgi:hypothetical protein